MGNVADRIGRRRLLLIGTLGFGAASVMAAFASSAGALIAARALLGVGGATIMPSTLSLIRNIFPDAHHRATAIAIWSAGGSGGAALGPLVGGALLEHFWWGSVFLINVPVMAAVIITGLWLLPESKNDEGAPVDMVSAILSVLAIVPIVYAVKSFAHNGLTALAMAALLAGLGRRMGLPTAPAHAGHTADRCRALQTPRIHLGDHRHRAGDLLPGRSAVLLLPVSAARPGLLHAPGGLTELPTSLASIAVVVVVASVVRRLGNGRALGGGLILAAVGLLVVAVGESYGGIIVICVGLLIIGAGIGLAFTVSTGAVLGSVPADRAGAASAISETGFELGVALGIAGAGNDPGRRLPAHARACPLGSSESGGRRR